MCQWWRICCHSKDRWLHKCTWSHDTWSFHHFSGRIPFTHSGVYQEGYGGRSLQETAVRKQDIFVAVVYGFLKNSSATEIYSGNIWSLAENRNQPGFWGYTWIPQKGRSWSLGPNFLENLGVLTCSYPRLSDNRKKSWIVCGGWNKPWPPHTTRNNDVNMTFIVYHLHIVLWLYHVLSSERPRKSPTTLTTWCL